MQERNQQNMQERLQNYISRCDGVSKMETNNYEKETETIDVYTKQFSLPLNACDSGHRHGCGRGRGRGKHEAQYGSSSTPSVVTNNVSYNNHGRNSYGRGTGSSRVAHSGSRGCGANSSSVIYTAKCKRNNDDNEDYSDVGDEDLDDKVSEVLKDIEEGLSKDQETPEERMSCSYYTARCTKGCDHCKCVQQGLHCDPEHCSCQNCNNNPESEEKKKDPLKD